MLRALRHWASVGQQQRRRRHKCEPPAPSPVPAALARRPGTHHVARAARSDWFLRGSRRFWRAAAGACRERLQSAVGMICSGCDLSERRASEL